MQVSRSSNGRPSRRVQEEREDVRGEREGGREKGKKSENPSLPEVMVAGVNRFLQAWPYGETTHT